MGLKSGTISDYFQFTEIQTKITSIFPFLTAVLYLSQKEQNIKFLETAIFFAGMFLFDLTTTAINNYIDTRTNGESIPYSRNKGKKIIFLMLGISIMLGLWLAFRTGWVVLIAGGLCFIVGILYTFGPLPISRTPLGEIVSGIFYGVFIPFILLYIHLPEGYFLSITLKGENLFLGFHLIHLMELLLLAVIPTLTTANIMLANNICDLEKDITQKRHSLPYYIGKKNAVKLFGWLYAIGYVTIPILIWTKQLHPISMLLLTGIIPVYKNVRIFEQRQVKKETFIVSIRNYLILNGSLVVALLSGIFLKNSIH